MFTSFSTALSALHATATAIDVVGHNLANLNTPGFKSSEVCFRDLVTQSIGAGLGETQVGFGTGLPLTIRQFTQGAIQTSSGMLDAAIQGDGFFIVKDSQGNTLYTRAGNFVADGTGHLQTGSGQRVQGWMTIDPATGAVNTNGPLVDIVVPVGSLKPPVATTSLTIDLNLDSTATAGASSQKTIPIVVYDSLGSSHVLTVHFEKTAANEWSYSVSIAGDDVTAGTAGTPFDLPGATGTLTFDNRGRLTDPPSGTPIEFEVNGLTDGAADLSLSWDPYTTAGDPRITQFGQPSASSASWQNGAPAAQLLHVGLGDGGLVLARYSDDTRVVAGQIAMASIRNPDTLIAAGDNNLVLSARTATPSVGVPETGGRGKIMGGAIETSTVDIANEFTKLIVYQRGYQANAHVVTTVDQLSQDTINLIR